MQRGFLNESTADRKRRLARERNRVRLARAKAEAAGLERLRAQVKADAAELQQLRSGVERLRVAAGTESGGGSPVRAGGCSSSRDGQKLVAQAAPTLCNSNRDGQKSQPMHPPKTKRQIRTRQPTKRDQWRTSLEKIDMLL